ncbi:uncharacterized protein B0H18DRAFT_1115847 [Fomitopsis serialis]|uniref:uncharacterized protein n=1 Tax=Fomitopsis serialis TaxID=139415 RepID=UPI002007BFCF|nr:uncharacterized protein B0H18DRAFT_1115847 [Neoantrodia serialis]KAH9932619.1 hypothetical protein B0H18DRAFT_1115847 [Neoantrodia serialis]
MSDDITAAIITIVNGQYVQNCCYIAAFAIYLFDHAITLGDQIDHIWRRRFSGVTALFIALHLSTIAVDWIADILYGIAGLIQGLVVGAIGALRIYAINGCDWRLPTLIFFLSFLTLVSTVYYCVSLTTGSLLPYINACVIYPTNPEIYTNHLCTAQMCVHLRIITVVAQVTLGSFSHNCTPVFIVSSACSIVAEALVVLSTWRYTYGMKKLAREVNQEVSLTYLLLRDGTIYFVMVLFLEVFAAIGQYVTVFAGVSGFTFALVTVVLSRFILNLRRAALRLTVEKHPGRGTNSTSASGPLSSISELQFNSRILGSLGGSLAFGSSDDDDKTGSADESLDVEVEEADEAEELTVDAITQEERCISVS